MTEPTGAHTDTLAELGLEIDKLREAISREYRDEVFNGAPQASSAANFGTVGINFRARKAKS